MTTVLRTFLSLQLVMALVLSGCGGESGPPPPPNTGISVVNTTGGMIDQVYWRASGSLSWGPNRLPASIPGFGLYVFYDIYPGNYDLRAVKSSTGTYEQLSISVYAGGTTTFTVY